MTSTSCVYFIQVQPNGPIKIGWTRGLGERISMIRSDCPYPVEVIGIIVNAGEKEESALHLRFAKHRIRGEWFNPSRSLMTYIRGHSTLWERVISRGIDHFNAALNDAKVLEIRRRHDEGEASSRLALEFDVTYQTIYSVLKGRTWKHVS